MDLSETGDIRQPPQISAKEWGVGLFAGGVFAPLIGADGAYAATLIFALEPGTANNYPNAIGEALWVSGRMTLSMLLIWGLLTAGRRLIGLAPRSVLAIGGCLAVAALFFLLDTRHGGVGRAVFHREMITVVILGWVVSITTAFIFGSWALVLAHLFSKLSAIGLVASGAIVAVIVSLLFEGTPLRFGSDGIVAALGFWLPAGVFTMGCCAATSGVELR
jgi:hypothetical protein